MQRLFRHLAGTSFDNAVPVPRLGRKLLGPFRASLKVNFRV